MTIYANIEREWWLRIVEWRIWSGTFAGAVTVEFSMVLGFSRLCILAKFLLLVR